MPPAIVAFTLFTVTRATPLAASLTLPVTVIAELEMLAPSIGESMPIEGGTVSTVKLLTTGRLVLFALSVAVTLMENGPSEGSETVAVKLPEPESYDAGEPLTETEATPVPDASSMTLPSTRTIRELTKDPVVGEEIE